MPASTSTLAVKIVALAGTCLLLTSAAAATFVHPNTLRYRLRRLAEVSGLELADPEQRFAAMLELRMLTRR